MKKKELCKADLTKELSEKIWFFKIAEGGAMGEPGGITFITNDGTMYAFNYIYADTTYEDVIVFFPVIKECRFGLFGEDSVVPEGWKYVNLGCGNHLLVNDKIYNDFLEEINDLKKPSEVYAAWQNKANKVMRKHLNPKVKNGLTEIVFILDKSGSMSGYEKDTIGGFNSTIEKQKQEEGKAIVSTVLFDHEIDVIHDRISIDDVPVMTNKEYQVRGTTALLDAIGGAIHHIGNIHKYARPEDVPEHTIFIITTDGMENASRNYDSRRVKEMIQRQQDRYGWEFIFLAANIDAVETADKYGIRRERAVNYCQTPEGVRESYCMMSEVISKVRKEENLDDGDWKKDKKKK